MDLPYYNSTNYPLAVREQLTQIPYTEEIASRLKYHQFLVHEFFTKNTHQRGLLIMHDMGWGKTKLAVSITTFYRQIDKRRKIIVLLSKSLEGNFRNTVKDYTQSSDEYVDKNYKFISLNASNMFKQISSVDRSKEEIEYEKRLGDFMADVTRDNSLDNSLLVIDEAHNLFNAITNGAKNATGLYDLIMKSKNLKLIFLTGTPVINDPFELVPCFNMLRGIMHVTEPNQSTDTTLFSESADEFEEFFVDRGRKTIKNKDKFMNRVFGLHSYYGEFYFVPGKERVGFPKELEPIVERVPMSQVQYAAYAIARLQELEETKLGYKAKGARFSSSTGGSSTYRVKSRQLSNYCIPEYALGPVRGAKAREKFIDRITQEDLLNTNTYSPKMGRVLENIKKNARTPGMVYSQFVSGEGIAIFARILEVHGYQNITDVPMVVTEHAIHDMQAPKLKRFAILSGDIDPEERQTIIGHFNNADNADGSQIALLLLSGAVAEGIDLKRIRHVHIMESFWNYARIRQVKTRAIRYMSHADLPPAQQNVQTYIYLSDYPLGHPKNKIREPTTDIELYQKSIDNMHIINQFLLALAESSVDCSLHYAKLPESVQKTINCKLCAPDNKMLFHPILTKDMTLPNNCHPYKEKKVTADEIILESTGEKYYYKKNSDGGFTLYNFNKKLNGYTPMPRNHVHYGDLMAQLITAN